MLNFVSMNWVVKLTIQVKKPTLIWKSPLSQMKVSNLNIFFVWTKIESKSLVQILNSNVNFDLITERERFELVSGIHQFPFSFILPTKIPSSFQTEMLAKFGYGHVRYSIKVVLKRSSRQINSETCRIPFTVN